MSSTLTRRDFLLDTAVAVGAGAIIGTGVTLTAQEPQLCGPPPSNTPPVPFTPNATLAIQPRTSAATLTASEIGRLRKAYQALRDLRMKDPSDPRGWLQQANIHCWNCGGGLKDTNAPDIHGSWLFLPWHRAYLYFHERILATLIGDPTFRLPYWDWDNSMRRALPPAYATPATAANSLFDRNRNAAASHMLPAQLVGPAIMNPIMVSSTFAAFGGDATGSGAIEATPHGGVHIWVGDRSLQSARADMGLLSTAAQDPLFFAHHGNIDRLWSVWLRSAKGHTNPTDKGWLGTRFTFYDENKRWTSISVADVLNSEQSLRYRYDSGAGLIEPGPDVRSTRLTISNGAIRLPATIAATSKAGLAAPRVSLLLQGLDVKDLPLGIVGIFDAAVSATPTTESAGYLGYVAIVPRTTAQKEHVHGPLRATVDLSSHLNRLAGRPDLRLVGASLTAAVEARKPVPLRLETADLVEIPA